MLDDSLTGADIKDGTVTDADINSAANIAMTKIAVPKALFVESVDSGATALTAVAIPSTSTSIVIPLYIRAPIDVNYVSVYVTRTTNVSIRLGIYDANGNRVWDSGARTVTATGVVTFTLGTTLQLPVGQYYLVFYGNSTNVQFWSGATSGIGANVPRQGTIAQTAMPATINLTTITKTAVRTPWMLLANTLT